MWVSPECFVLSEIWERYTGCYKRQTGFHTNYCGLLYTLEDRKTTSWVQDGYKTHFKIVTYCPVGHIFTLSLVASQLRYGTDNMCDIMKLEMIEDATSYIK